MESLQDRTWRRYNSPRYNETTVEIGFKDLQNTNYSRRFKEDYLCILLVDLLEMADCHFLTIGNMDDEYNFTYHFDELFKDDTDYPEDMILIKEVKKIEVGTRMSIQRLYPLLKLMHRYEFALILVNEKRKIFLSIEDGFRIWIHMRDFSKYSPELMARYPHIYVKPLTRCYYSIGE